ncbi:MAG TPA: polysaccharide deacetylase family protein [Ktedonobacterales bacterium]
MDEIGGSGALSEEAPTAIATAVKSRPIASRRTRRSDRYPRGGRSRRLAARLAITLFSLLMVASVAVSLIESNWQSFNPVSGIGILWQTQQQPQTFGDTGNIAPVPPSAPQGTVAAISGRTHKPTAPHTPTPGSRGWSGNYPASWTGSWSGGVGQGCPSGGAPKPRPYVIYNAASYGVYHTNMVALTFDDGPTPTTTLPILSFLEQSHTPATFFVMGQYAHAYPWLIQREAADGFAIGVHTWNHPDMRLLSIDARAYQLGATIQQLHADLGSGFCAWLWRPPYGAFNQGIIDQAGAFGLTTVNWDVDPQDWARPGTMVIVQRVLSQVRPGSIILMHDGPAAREQTAAALPYILAGLRSRGLVPVTLPTLLNSDAATAAPPVVTPTVTPVASPTATDTPAATATATPAPTATTVTSAPTPTPTATTAPAASLWPSPSASEPFALSLLLWYDSASPGYAGA